MRLLFVTPQLPWPPSQGTTLRNYHLVQAAASQHTVDLLSFDTRQEASVTSDLGRLASLCRRIETVPAPPRPKWRRLLDLSRGYADMERRLWTQDFARKLGAMIHDGAYDAVQLEGFEVAGYLLGPAALYREASDDGPPLPPIIFDEHNAEYELQASAGRIDWAIPRRWPRALYSEIQARRLRRREALYCSAADVCLAVSAEDAAALDRIAPGVRPIVVPNGIDCAAIPPPSPGSQPTIFFAGKLDYRPNVDACEWLVRDILPLVQARVPDAHVVLAGRDPAPSVQQLAGPPVEVTGSLSEEELATRRAAASIYAVPMRMGSGVRFKALEAMAAGVPLVATTLGASGSGAAHDQHALIADDAQAFADSLVRLLVNEPDRRRLAAAARSLAEATHDWRHITPRLLAVYERLAAPPPPSSVITTLLNEAHSVPTLMQSLSRQSAPPAEVVAADGGSTDGTQELITHHSSLITRLLDAPGANISRGRNRAIAAATNDAIAATDGGVVLHPGWLARLTWPLARDPDLQTVSGFFVAAPHSTWERALGATTLPAVDEIDPARFLPSSRSVAFRRRAWEAAGGYPEWLDYCEDLLFDFALRDRCGPLRFQPRAIARFRPRPSPASFFKQYYRYARGDGKAGLWPRRHAIRYATYLVGVVLAWQALKARERRIRGAGLLLLGGSAYLRRPLQRLAQQCESPVEFARTAPLVPLVRLIGDVAKMLGYPPGVLWRLRYRAVHGRRPGEE